MPGDWETCTNVAGTTGCVTATFAPSAANSNLIVIRPGHDMHVSNAGNIADQLTVRSGGTLTIDPTRSLTINNGTGIDVQVDGTLLVGANGNVGLVTSGSLTVGNGGSLVVNGFVTWTNLVAIDIDAGGTATVNLGGTMLGAGGSLATRPTLTIGGTLLVNSGGIVNLDGSGRTIVVVEGSPALFDVKGYVNGSDSVTVNSGGQLAVSPGGFGFQMSGGTLTVHGTLNDNWVVTGMNTVNTSSGAQINVTVNLSLASISSLNIVSGAALAVSGSGVVSVTRGNGGGLGSITGTATFSDSSRLVIDSVGTAFYTVGSGGVLDLGPSAVVEGAGFLAVAAGAFLNIASAGGISHLPLTGNVQTTGSDTYSTAANYTYDGATQVTGNALPATIATLTVASTGVVTISSLGVVQTVTGLTAVTSGTLDQGPTINLTAGGGISVALGATYRDFGTGDLTLGAGLSNAGTVQMNGTTSACPEADAILIRSSATGTQRPWSGAGTFDLKDVDVRDQAGTAPITVLSGTNSLNNGANWTFIAGCVADATAPTVTLSGGGSGSTNTATFGVTAQFSETVFGFTAGDVDTSANATVSNFVAVDGDTYTFDVTATSDGTVTVDVPAASANDLAGNNNTASNQLSWIYDNTAPTVALSGGGSGTTNTATFGVTAQFSETVTGFTISDVDNSPNTSISNFIAVDGDTYTFDVTANSDGAVTVEVPAASAVDAANNGNTASNQLSWIYDATAPTVTLSGGGSGSTNTATFGVTAQFSETVFGFTAGDVDTSANATVSNFVAVDGDTYTFDVTATSDGTVTVDVPAASANDLAGNNNTASNQLSWIYDNTAPTVALSGGGSGTTNTATFGVTAQFSETVTGFTISDVDNSANTSISNFIAVDGDTYTFDVTANSDGAVTVEVPAASAVDAANNGNTASNQLSWIYDATGPTVNIDKAFGQDDPTNDSPINFTVTFNEDVADFTAADLTITGTAGATTALVTGGPQVYNVAVSGMTSDGSVTLTFTGTATDAAGNANQAPTYGDNTVIYDTTGPTVNVDKAFGQDDPTNDSPINFTVTFNEDVADFTAADLTITGTAGATTALVTGGPQVYNVAVSGMTSDGSVTLTFTGTATDAASNANQAPTYGDNTVIYDTTAPAVSAPDLDPASDTGASSTDDLTSDTSPTFNGTSEALAFVELLRDGSVIAFGSASIGGTWSLTDPNAQPDATYTYTARATDEAGNTSAESTGLAVTIDTAAPAIDLATWDDPIFEGNVTSVDASGTAEIGATVTVTLTDGVITLTETTTADAFGDWSVTFDASTLADGTVTYEATATDAAGNSATDTAADGAQGHPRPRRLDPGSRSGQRLGCAQQRQPDQRQQRPGLQRHRRGECRGRPAA